MKTDQPNLCRILDEHLRRWDPEDLVVLAEDVLGADISFDNGLFSVRWNPPIPEMGDVVRDEHGFEGVVMMSDRTTGMMRLMDDGWKYKVVSSMRVEMVEKAADEPTHPLAALAQPGARPRDFIRQVIARARKARDGSQEEKDVAQEEIREINRLTAGAQQAHRRKTGS